ncbi:hypothetical protein HC891_26560, partial [Candidatus Gracilibacteria bacterium]|nr:hypothetical protein [Candidatus Gracilibacteria bacterium]
MILGMAIATAVLIYLLRPTPSVRVIQDVPVAPTSQTSDAPRSSGVITGTEAGAAPMVVVVMSSYQVAEWIAYLGAGSAAIGALVLLRTRRKRLMQYTDQSAAMFMDASSPETRAANEHILTDLARQGIVVPGFTDQVSAVTRLPQTSNDLHAQAVLRVLDEAGNAVAFATIRELTGISHMSLRLVLRDLVQRKLIARVGETYTCTRSGQRALAPQNEQPVGVAEHQHSGVSTAAADRDLATALRSS